MSPYCMDALHTFYKQRPENWYGCEQFCITRTEFRPASSRSEFSSYLLGDQTPTAVSWALWDQITAVGGVRTGMAKTRGNADTSNLK